MSRSFDLDPVDRITAGAVGEPGQRIFYVQARSADEQVTLLAEKEQVRLLGEALQQLLSALPDAPEEDAPDERELALHDPLEPEWRAGSMSIEYDEIADRVAIIVQEAQSEGEQEGSDPEPPPAPEPAPETARARFVASRSQVRAMAERALVVVAAGRPRCQFCNEPIDPDGHVCPAMNGHRRPRD